MKETFKRITICLVVALLALTPTTIASAHDGENHDDGDTPVSSTDTQRAQKVRDYKARFQAQLQQSRDAREMTANKRADLKERLTDAKKQVCEKIQDTINKVMVKMNDRRKRVFDRLTKISEAVENYVTKNDLDVAGYDELTAAVEAAKSSAKTTMEKQQAVPKLDCSGEQPRADVADFKEKRLESIQAMKTYRDAVKALVKTVKAAAEQKEAS